MPAFTTIINNIYLVIVPVGILLGANAQDYKSFTMTFIFYFAFCSGNRWYFKQNNVYLLNHLCKLTEMLARMERKFSIYLVLPQTTSPKKTQKDDVVFDNVSFTYTGKKRRNGY